MDLTSEFYPAICLVLILAAAARFLFFRTKHTRERGVMSEDSLVKALYASSSKAPWSESNSAKPFAGITPETVKQQLAEGADMHHDREYALRWACASGRDDLVTVLLESGADIHADEEGALRAAVQNCRAVVVDLLLAEGADPHINNDEILKTAQTRASEDIAYREKHIAEALARKTQEPKK